MNIIDTHKEGNILTVTVNGHFNLRTKNLIESRLTMEIDRLIINLINCKYIDSEGVIFLHEWQDKGNELLIKKPPPILFEIVEILQLSDSWDFDKMIINQI